MLCVSEAGLHEKATTCGFAKCTATHDEAYGQRYHKCSAMQSNCQLIAQEVYRKPQGHQHGTGKTGCCAHLPRRICCHCFCSSVKLSFMCFLMMGQ
jgi:hypothetical protein